MTSITPLSITAHTFAVEHELNERRHHAAVHGQFRGQLHGLLQRARQALFGPRRPSPRRQRPAQPISRPNGTACAS